MEVLSRRFIRRDAVSRLDNSFSVVYGQIIKKWGNSVGILLDSEDLKIMDLKIGDIVDIEIEKLNKQKGGQK